MILWLRVNQAHFPVLDPENVATHLIFVLEGVHERHSFHLVLEVEVEIHGVWLLVVEPLLAVRKKLPLVVKLHDEHPGQSIPSTCIVDGGDSQHLLLLVHAHGGDLFDQLRIPHSFVEVELTNFLVVLILQAVQEDFN